MSHEAVKLNSQAITQFTPEQLALITNTVARGASKDELQLFLYRCQNMGLDPLKPGMIHFIKYGSGPGTIVVGIDGFRAKAARSGALRGIKRGVIRDDNGKAVGGWAEVYRADWTEPARLEVSMQEYNTGKGPWQKMPESMIQKVAEAGALRMAFPDDLGGIYVNEEMDQANRGIRPEQPGPEDGVQSDEYCCPSNLKGKFGRLAKKPISQADPALLREAVVALEDHSKATNKAIPPWAQEFIRQAEPFIAKFESALPVEGSFEDFEPGSAE